MSFATYDPIQKLIILDQIAPVDGVVSVNVGNDLYSDAKRQWLEFDYLNQFAFPWGAIGGQELPGGAIAPQIFFLKAPWTIRPYEADHKVDVQKNLFRDDGEPVFVPVLGDFTVEVDVLNEFSAGDPRVDTAIDKLMRLLALYEGNPDITQAVVDGANGRHIIRDRETDEVLLDKTVTKTGDRYEFEDT